VSTTLKEDSSKVFEDTLLQKKLGNNKMHNGIMRIFIICTLRRMLLEWWD